jgi:hypothetical protein
MVADAFFHRKIYHATVTCSDPSIQTPCWGVGFGGWGAGEGGGGRVRGGEGGVRWRRSPDGGLMGVVVTVPSVELGLGPVRSGGEKLRV